jgi:periplasmic copper chaperone A
MNRMTAVAAVTAAAALAVPAAASAHVTVNPPAAVPGSFSIMTVRVPNERDNKGTRRVDLRLPRGIFSLSYKKVPGWKIRVFRKKLSKPVNLGEFSVDERFSRVTFTARRSGIVRPGQFEEFPLSVRVPDGDPGDVLTFRAIQVYQGGEKVRWTGAPNSDTPAPRVTLVAPAPATAALAGPLAAGLLR